ncbi:MAG: hypothetical protein LBD50_01815 [Rickettsiales bacterium]|jgi:hypothetical protein|nr:hypothetical protein [Rickettsiales bacterium]
MKITCDFCKTEYSVGRAPVAPVQCAVCGHVWTVARQARGHTFLVFAAAVCALLAAAVFSFAIIINHRAESLKKKPLAAHISEVHSVIDAFGAPHFVVSGKVINRSEKIYGVPDLVITSRDDAGNIVAQQKFMPSATLLDAGEEVKFSHTLSASSESVKKITVELSDQ